jgi:hypothetical protein
MNLHFTAAIGLRSTCKLDSKILRIEYNYFNFIRSNKSLMVEIDDQDLFYCK